MPVSDLLPPACLIATIGEHIFNPIVLSKRPVEEAREMSESLSSKRPRQVEDEVRTNYSFSDPAYDT